MKQTLLTLGLLTALQAVAADQSTNTTASATFSKAQIAPTYPAVEYKLEVKVKKIPVEDQGKIMRFEGLSSQPWTTIATRNSKDSMFHGRQAPEPIFFLSLLSW